MSIEIKEGYEDPKKATVTRKVRYGPPDSDPIDVETNDITIFCHQGQWDVKILDVDVVEIKSPQTQQWAMGLENDAVHPKTKKYFQRLFNLDDDNIDLVWAFEKDKRSRIGGGQMHALGLIDMTLKTLDAGKTPFWQYPESHLHPAIQANLADFLVAMQNKLYERTRCNIMEHQRCVLTEKEVYGE